MIQRHGRRFGAVLLAGALIAAACSDDDEPDAEPADSESVAESPDTAEITESDAGSASTDETSTEPGDTSDATDPSEPADTSDSSEPSDTTDPSQSDESDDSPAPLENEEQITSEGEGGDPADEGPPVAGGEITWGLTNDGTGFDTTGAFAEGHIRVIGAVNDSLVGLDINGDWAPNLAESLTPSDDFTSWTIALRPDVTFHDGEPVDAAAVVANLDAQRASPTVGFGLAPITSVEAVDDLTVEISLSAPWAQFPQLLVGQPGWMVSPSTIGTNDTFVGTGPFMLESWTPGDSVRVVRNPNYWRADEGLPYLDAINFRYLTDQTVKRQALEAGDIEGYVGPGDEDILDFLDDDAIDVWIGTAGANEYLWILNTAVPPFDDIRVRRAVAHAIDKQFIIDTFRSGLTEPANGPYNPSSRWYVENDYPQYDPDAAAALVEEYEAEVGPIEFEITTETAEGFVEPAEVMIDFLADVGIDATLREIGPGQSATYAIQDDFQAFNWGQFGAPDPDRDYVFFHSSGGLLNWSNLVSADIDEGLDIGRENNDYETRLEGYAQFQQALGDEVPMIWIDHLNGIEAAVSIPELNGINRPGTLPDGSPGLPMTDGSFFAWGKVWLEQ